MRVTRDGVFFKCWCYRHQSLRRELELTPAFKKICETFIKIHPQMLAAVYQAAAQMHWPSKAVKQTACGEYVVQLPIEARSRFLIFLSSLTPFRTQGCHDLAASTEKQHHTVVSWREGTVVCGLACKTCGTRRELWLDDTTLLSLAGTKRAKKAAPDIKNKKAYK